VRRIRIPGLVDIVQSDAAAEIMSMARDQNLDRAYSDHSIPANARVLQRVHDALQIDGKPFPTVAPRCAAGRAETQDALWKRLAALAPAYSAGPASLEPLAAFVRGAGEPDACGPLVQQAVGTLFAADFNATPESWNAALVLDKAPRTLNPVLLAAWAATGEVDKAKRLLAGMVGGDLAAVHAIGIAVHNIVKGVNLMRQLYCEPSSRAGLTPDSAASSCIFAPEKILRQPIAPENSTSGELETGTLIILQLQAAHSKAPDADLAFLRGTWSQCPAEGWVPALFEGIWRRACSSQAEGQGRTPNTGTA
jgi:hypothetical protein